MKAPRGRAPTAFQQRVYAQVARIPRGRVTTYAEVARAIGCGSPRAVGQALRVNPFAPDVPCHRVIASDGSLGGFQGAREGAALRRKARLLEAEGVRVVNGRVALHGRVKKAGWSGQAEAGKARDEGR